MATTKKTTAKKAASNTTKKTTKVPVAEQVECIPKDPGMENGDQFFEININGINYRFKRGEVLTHPKGFYEFIAYKLSLRENISPEVAEFLNNSKKLN